MPDASARRIIDLEWPTRYLLECGHAVAIAPDASVAEMALPGQLLPCPTCDGTAPAEVRGWLEPFKAGEAINALALNARLAQIEARLSERGGPCALSRFGADEPINATSLNRRLAEIEAALG